MSAPLSYYIQCTHRALGMQAPVLPIFAGPDPVLRKDTANKILYFYGGFNPAHTAHLLQLTVALERSFPEHNVPAALVGPLYDDHVRIKAEETADTNESGRDIWFSCEDRAALWAGTEKAWALPVESREDFKHYMLTLQIEAWAESIEIQLVQLVGIEYVRVEQPLNFEVGNVYVDIVCSNAGTRPASFEDENGIPQDLAWCGPWTLMEETGEGDDKVKLWTCRINEAKDGKELRYVQFAQSPMLGEEVSATKVREMMVAGGDVEQEPLKSLVLRSDLLKSMQWNWVMR